MGFRGWQTEGKTLPVEISNAVQKYIQMNGYPPQILEISEQVDQKELPEGLQMVVHAVRLPKNVMFVGTEDETDTY